MCLAVKKASAKYFGNKENRLEMATSQKAPPKNVPISLFLLPLCRCAELEIRRFQFGNTWILVTDLVPKARH
jgi:hypothetical protein